MEIEYFCRAEDGMRLTDEWLEERLKFYEEIGIPRDKLHVLDVPDGERAHYSKKTYDIEYEFPFGIQELEGVAYRTDYDLKAHQEAVRQAAGILRRGEQGEVHPARRRADRRLRPHRPRPDLRGLRGGDSHRRQGQEETRTVLHFDPKMAPIKCGIFPLLKKKPELVAKAQRGPGTAAPADERLLRRGGAVGRRYRRQDEVGTPFCVTIDFDTIGENGPEHEGTVTVRERDSMEQTRIPIAELAAHLLQRIH